MTRPLALAAIAVFANANANPGQDPFIHVPSSSVSHAETAGFLAHTNHLIYTGPSYNTEEPVLLAELPPHGPVLSMLSSPSGYHPNQLREAYGATTFGHGAIAIVDAYHYATAKNDFNVFSQEFGLPLEGSKSSTASTNAVFQVVYESGTAPSVNASWNEEEALDIEWAHAMAPDAKIYLVEANSSGLGDLAYSATLAAQLPGVRQVSMSWGSGEFSSESFFDSYFTAPGVTFFASSGDTGAVVEWPSVSPNVIGVGGTSLTLSNGKYGSESAWSSGGGGSSAYESLPSFQAHLGLTNRTAPDISADANPSTGVAVYDSTPDGNYVGWMVFGGTSVAAPVVAGLANAEGVDRGSAETAWIYAHHTLFHDIVSGGTGPYTSSGHTYYTHPATTGYDLATGWGSPSSGPSL